MKKFYLTALLAAAAIIPSQAKIVKWGVEGGMNLNRLKTDNAFSSDNRCGWFLGPKVQTKSFAGVMFDASLQYSQMYMDIENKEKGLPHVILPVNVKYSIGVGSLAAVYVATGPQWNWYVGDKNISWAAGADYRASFERSTFSWNFGLGVHLIKHLQIGASYNLGFGKSFADVKGNVAGALVTSDTWKNNNFQVRLAYIF